MLEEKSANPRLGEFILNNMEPILFSWEDFARRFWRGPTPDVITLRNHAERMLRALVDDMDTPQTKDQQKSKSEGEYAEVDSQMNQAALGHALARVNDGFNVGRMVAEFRALRASVSRLWSESVPTPHKEQIEDMGRFNEALDQLVTASVEAFTERIDRSRRLFLGILGHDLRQPVGSMRMFTEILGKSNLPPAEAAPILSGMAQCCDAIAKMLSDLLDFTTSQLGSAFPVRPVSSDLGMICQEVVFEVEAATPGKVIRLDITGDLAGEWDGPRLRQMISNLLANAVHHGSSEHPIDVIVKGSTDEVMLAVHNMGRPIAPESINILFDPMVRVAVAEKNRPQGSIGLGLYICRQIAIAHGGEIRVVSSTETGTTFTVLLPRLYRGDKDQES